MGAGKGKTRAQDAAVSAINSPLLDFPIKKAKGIVFNVCGGTDLTLQEVRQTVTGTPVPVSTDVRCRLF